MDKNLINIDDLVRQRLMGGEEEERPGAWLRMNDLLEKELPKARPVGFTWRRIFGASAILLLISALSVGGYEMNAYMNRNSSTNAVATSTPATGSVNVPVSNNTNSQPTTTTATANNNEQNNNANNQDKNNQNKNNQPIAANVNHTNNKPAHKHLHKTAIAANAVNTASQTDATNTGKVTAANNKSTENKKTGVKVVAANTAAITNPTDANNTGKAGDANNKGTENRKTPAKVVAANTATIANPTDAINMDKAGDANKKGTENKKTSAVAVKSTSTHHRVKSVNKTESKDAVATKTTNKTANKDGKKTDQAGTTVNKTGATGDQVAVAGKTQGHKLHSKANNNTTLVSKTGLVLSSSAPKAIAAKQAVSKDNNLPAKHTAHKTNTNTHGRTTQSDRLALNSSTGTAKHAPVAKAVVNKTHKNLVKKEATAIAVKKGHDKHVANNPAKTGSRVAKKDGNNNSSTDVAALTPQRVQRVIPRMVIQERLMRTSPTENNYHLDTISFGNFTEDYDLPTALKPGSHRGAKDGGNDLVANNSTAPGSDPAIKPGSSTKDDESSSSKENSENKKSTGQRAVENLSAAFNDIKVQAGHATFASGITGGINGTFFGPNSFKGFQFGVTGKFTFSDVLAIMGELKYVHRINNGYSLNDNYYNYAALPGGGYSKQLVENPYSISTLHSIELPVTIRYCINNFNFFVGGNFAYMFAINTGDYPTVATNIPATTVQTQGNDNAGKIKANDFNSRFGIGYTFGASYQVSPRVTLDLRDVQTFWDNSKTEGAKYISSQLYKSPSFQLSIGYRFGGEKKDKE